MSRPPQDIAHQLAAQHAGGIGFASIAGLADEAEAYAVQAAYVSLMCGNDLTTVAGYKIGLTSQRMQDFCGIDHPIAGAVLRSRLHDSGARIRWSLHGRLGLEFEIAVRMARDLPAASAPFSLETIAGAVESVAPAVELVDDRNADYSNLDVLSLVADISWNAGIVVGDFHTRWPDLPTLAGTVFENGVQVDQGKGSDVLGHPFTALHWLANHLAETGGGLRAGDVVMTGSLVTTRFPMKGAFRFELQGLGAVELEVIP